MLKTIIRVCANEVPLCDATYPLIVAFAHGTCLSAAGKYVSFETTAQGAVNFEEVDPSQVASHKHSENGAGSRPANLKMKIPRQGLSCCLPPEKAVGKAFQLFIFKHSRQSSWRPRFLPNVGYRQPFSGPLTFWCAVVSNQTATKLLG